jgi:DNA-binding CsgD family transcriptional regulator
VPRPPPTAASRPLATLTGRDLEALHHLAAGRSTAAIAAAMSVSTNTVRTRIHRLQNKLGAPARDQVVPRARALGLLPGWTGPPGSSGTIPAQRGADHHHDRVRRYSPRLA